MENNKGIWTFDQHEEQTLSALRAEARQRMKELFDEAARAICAGVAMQPYDESLEK